MVLFLFSLVKNKDRVLKAMDAMDGFEKRTAWLAKTMASGSVTSWWHV